MRQGEPGPIIDLSMTIHAAMPLWPGSEPVLIRALQGLEDGAETALTHLSLEAHTGTHLDAPAHLIPGGARVEDLPLALLIGLAYVVETFDAPVVTAARLEAADIPAEAQRLLVKTDNSRRPPVADEGFNPRFVALAPDAADWIAERKIGLVGIDALSIEPYDSPDLPVHRRLLGRGVAIIEGLVLRGVAPGRYTLVCLPLKLAGVEGAPARAVLLPG